MTRLAALAVLAVAIAGCASSSSGLPYKPTQPLSGASVSADYAVLVDQLRVEIDTGRHQLENAEILKADGTTIRAQTIEHAPLQSSNPRSVGPGVGSYRWGSSTGGRVGGGVSTGGDIDSNWVGGNTLAFFALDQVGPAPWRLRVTLAGREPVVIVLDASTGGR
jgi:hypothetical protein